MNRTVPSFLLAPRRPDHGMTTSEYAVGTVGAASIALVLVHLAGSTQFLELVRDWIELALDLDLGPLREFRFGHPFRGLR